MRTSLTPSTSSIQREVIQAQGHRGSNQKSAWMGKFSMRHITPGLPVVFPAPARAPVARHPGCGPAWACRASLHAASIGANSAGL